MQFFFDNKIKVEYILIYRYFLILMNLNNFNMIYIFFGQKVKNLKNVESLDGQKM